MIRIVFLSIATLLLLLDCFAEPFFEEGELGHQIGNCVGESVLGRVLGRGLDAQHELVLERVGEFVAGK